VTTGANCTWAPEPLDSWLRVDSTDPRVGSGRVTFTVAANTLAAREGRLRVAGQTLTVAQGAACIYDVSPLSLTVDANGSTTSVTVTTAALCEWTAQSSTSWLSVRPSSGAGSATVAVVAEANPGAERQGTVTVADRTVTVSQAASCNLGLTPTSVTHGPEAQSQSLAVATGPTCAWSASSNASWLLLTNTTGIGPGGVGYSLPVNRGPQRTGNITVSRTGAAVGMHLHAYRRSRIATATIRRHHDLGPGMSMDAAAERSMAQREWADDLHRQRDDEGATECRIRLFERLPQRHRGAVRRRRHQAGSGDDYPDHIVHDHSGAGMSGSYFFWPWPLK